MRLHGIFKSNAGTSVLKSLPPTPPPFPTSQTFPSFATRFSRRSFRADFAEGRDKGSADLSRVLINASELNSEEVIRKGAFGEVFRGKYLGQNVRSGKERSDNARQSIAESSIR